MIVQEDMPTILQQFIQPRVIDQNMLINLIIDQGPKKETGRLFIEDGIKLDETKEIRIEFLNILKIDNLWMMSNLVKLKLSNNIIERIENLDTLIHLKELDLSFNHITIMENLNNLTKLEILLLYNNKISKIEAIDSLLNLMIFSIGNNSIADLEHVQYLRKFKKLHSLNMSNNPCTEKDGYSDYVFAFIPHLIYYQYKMITDNEKKVATEIHYRALSTLEDIEAKEKEELDAQEKHKIRVAYLSNAYVEYLDGDYLFQDMFANDKEGIGLSLVNEETQNAYEEYKESFIKLCQELCELGLKEHDNRTNEIDLYNKAVNEGKETSQNQGRIIVNTVLQKKHDTLTTVKSLLKQLTDDMDNATLEDMALNAQQLSEGFNDMVADAWSKLMSIEVELHEQMEDINEIFRANIGDMVDTFLTNARGYFSQLRNRQAEYNDTINGLVLYFLSGFGDDTKIPTHLQDLCRDKDALSYNLSTSHEKHLQAIDTQEDTMVKRLNSWFDGYAEQILKDERERNHQQILEISHFAECQEKELNSLQLSQQLNLNIGDEEIITALEN